MKKVIENQYLLMCFAMIFFLGCGGGGSSGGGTQPSVVRTFHLNEEDAFKPGYSLAFSLTGSCDCGDSFNGKLSIAIRNVQIVDGTPAIPQDTLFEFRNLDTGAFVSELGTAYYDETTSEPIKIVFPASGIEWTPVIISELPDIAKIGDFGTTTSYVSSDGKTLTGTWSLEDAGNNTEYMIGTSTTKLSNGDIENVTKFTRRIDESGETLSIAYEIWFPSLDATINFTGTRL